VKDTLKRYIQSQEIFLDWIKLRIEKYGFIVNEDYVIRKVMNNTSGGRPFEEYH
jgi:phage anti-repressor protein